MNQISFAEVMGLRPADVVIVPKSALNLLEHYLVYWGVDSNGEHFYLENNNQVGVRWIPEVMFQVENLTFRRLKPFPGNDYQRAVATNRGISMLGHEYNLQNFNCEHFANFVQYGYSYSEQINSAKKALAVGGLTLGLIAIIGRL